MNLICPVKYHVLNPIKIKLLVSNNTFKIVLFIQLFIATSFSPLFAETLISQDKKPKFDISQDIKDHINTINQTLLINHQQFKNSKLKLANFVDDALLPIWSSTKTVKGLMGKKIWQELAQDKQFLLVKGFNETLQRYVQEGFEHYDQQQIEFVSLNLNEKQTNGFLTIKLTPNLLPSFNIDFKVSVFDNKWYLYDALIQGASYISLKKDYYRDLFKKHKIDGVISYINQKNSVYMSSASK